MTKDIYSPPIAEPLPAEPIGRKRGRKLAVWGCALLAGPAIGMLIMIVAMIGAFGDLSASGQADPEDLAGKMEVALVATMVGLALNIVGGVFCSMALFGRGNRERWFQVVGMVLAALSLFMVPTGTIVGVVVVIGFIMRWGQFSRSGEEVARG